VDDPLNRPERAARAALDDPERARAPSRALERSGDAVRLVVRTLDRAPDGRGDGRDRRLVFALDERRELLSARAAPDDRVAGWAPRRRRRAARSRRPAGDSRPLLRRLGAP
jgi:hypothetical protein